MRFMCDCVWPRAGHSSPLSLSLSLSQDLEELFDELDQMGMDIPSEIREVRTPGVNVMFPPRWTHYTH